MPLFSGVLDIQKKCSRSIFLQVVSLPLLIPLLSLASADWTRNKIAHPWYIPPLCHHFSNSKQEDWDLSPTDNNLNEMSHPATTWGTGVGLSLLEAVLKYVFEVIKN